MYNSLLLEKTSHINDVVFLMKKKTSKFNRLARLLVLELSIFVVFTAGVYAGIYGTKAYGYDYFVKKSRNFLKNTTEALLGIDKKKAEQAFNNTNAFIVVMLIFITLQLWSLYKLTSSDASVDEPKDYDRIYNALEPDVKRAQSWAETHKPTNNKFYNYIIGGFLIAKSKYAKDKSISEFLTQTVVKIQKNILSDIVIPTMTVLVVFLYVLQKSKEPK